MPLQQMIASAILPIAPSAQQTISQAFPDIALIHGWGFGRTVWQTLLTPLSQTCRVHLVDLPGYGVSPPDSASFRETVEHIVDDLPEGTILCGWSLGGMLAQQAALLFPQRFGGLILIGSSPCFMQRGNWADGQPPELLESFADAVAKNPATTLQRFNALLNQGDLRAKNTIRLLGQALSAAPIPDTASLLKGLDWLRDVDLRPQITSIELHVSLIHGDRDPLIPLQAAQWMASSLHNAHLEIIPGAAHALFINDPENIARLISNDAHAFTFNQTARPRVV